MSDPKDVEVPNNSHQEEKEAAALELDDVRDQKMENEVNEAAMDAELAVLEEQLQSLPPRRMEMTLKNPAMFTWILVAFASMGGLLSGIDQSLISGANLSLPSALSLSANQASLVDAGMPLGAVGGALILSPTNEYLGRRMAIIVSCILYTVGAALEAGAINFGMIFAGRFILGAGVGLEGGTVPVYVAECGKFDLLEYLLDTPANPYGLQSRARFVVTSSRCTSSTSPWVKSSATPSQPSSSASKATGATFSAPRSSSPPSCWSACSSSPRVPVT